jgi:endo-1,4-beta-xylanase
MFRSILIAAILAGLPSYAQPLRELADHRGVRIGAAVDPARLSEGEYAGVLAREFNQIEPENSAKFGPIHPSPNGYNWGPMEALVAFGGSHQMAVRGHTLVWHRQNPAWLTKGDASTEQLATTLQEHIASVVGHFAGKIYAWDVVNEAFNDDGTFRSTLWSDSPGIGFKGTGYIEQALRWAHVADPKALLFYNDYSAEGMNAKSDAIYKMAQDFKERGVPLDGIGLQMHLTANPPPLAGMESNIKRLTELGLQVQITELDVRLPIDSAGKASETLLATQAQVYRDVVALCLKFPRCTAVQIWGFTDKYSWVPRSFQGTGAALPFDALFQPKPAYDAIQSAFRRVSPEPAKKGKQR